LLNTLNIRAHQNFIRKEDLGGQGQKFGECPGFYYPAITKKSRNGEENTKKSLKTEPASAGEGGDEALASSTTEIH